MTRDIAQVLLDSPLPRLDHLFDYRVPAELLDTVVPGVRVKVPLRVAGRVADGYVIAVTDTTTAPGRLAEVDTVVSAVPVLAPEVWRLARAVADRAAGMASDVVRLAVPKRQARVEAAWLAAERPAPEPVEPGDPPAVVGALLAGRRIAALATPAQVQAGELWIGAWAVEIAAVAAGVVAAGRDVIVAVPDRRDLEQLAVALAAGPAASRVLRVDAGQSAPARYRAHLAALEPVPRIRIGNRAAVYAPAGELGAIIVWDEADAFHREPLAPGAATRDVALLRQEQSGAGLLFLSHTRSSAVQRLVEIGWCESASPPHPVPNVILTPEDDFAQRIPSAAWRDARLALEHGPVLVQVARPGEAALRSEQPMPIDAGRTAHELGKAFPGIPVIVADGDHVRDTVGAEPALVVATRGAEPRAPGGYRAVLLLDGSRMLARESLWVAEDCLRWWANAAALAAPRAPVHLVGVHGDLGLALATWRSPDFAAKQLADRRELRFPPAVRLAQLTGPGAAVESLLASLPAAEVLVRGDDPAGERVTVRFGYGAGAAVAAAVKAALIASTGRGRGANAAPTLRVRLDVHEPV